MTDRRPPSLARLAVAGTLGGLVASAAMNGALKLASRLEDDEDGGGKPSTVKLADTVSKAATGEAIDRKNWGTASRTVHYATGAVLGAIYAVGARWLPEARAGWGTGYGAATAAVLDEGLVPALGLAPPPTETPLSSHLESGVGHLVFGLALESVVRVIAGPPEE